MVGSPLVGLPASHAFIGSRYPFTPTLRTYTHTELSMSSGQGALTQYTRLPAVNLVPRSKNVTPTQAAGFSLAGLTAYQSLIGVGKLEAGQSVFINGGSTAVGSFAIQIAKAKGAHVTASASAKNEEYVRSLGADEVRARRALERGHLTSVIPRAVLRLHQGAVARAARGGGCDTEVPCLLRGGWAHRPGAVHTQPSVPCTRRYLLVGWANVLGVQLWGNCEFRVERAFAAVLPRWF